MRNNIIGGVAKKKKPRGFLSLIFKLKIKLFNISIELND